MHVYIEGGSGNDIICLHDQDNTSNGCDEYASGDQNWDGTFEIYGGANIDHIDGAMTGDYVDYVDGGTGSDRIYTYGGDDEIDAGPGDDHVWAGDGDDTVNGDNE